MTEVGYEKLGTVSWDKSCADKLGERVRHILIQQLHSIEIAGAHKSTGLRQVGKVVLWQVLQLNVSAGEAPGSVCPIEHEHPTGTIVATDGFLHCLVFPDGGLGQLLPEREHLRQLRRCRFQELRHNLLAEAVGLHAVVGEPFSAIEARVIAWFAGETWRQEVFSTGGDIYCASASQMFKVPVEKHGINGHLRQKGKIAELALGYGGSVGALKAMGALEMGLTEEELPQLVDAWRQSNPNIVKFWWAVDRAVMEAVRYKHTTTDYGLTFSCRSGMLFITLPSGRKLAYVKPKVGTNKFGGECIKCGRCGANYRCQTHKRVDGTVVRSWYCSSPTAVGCSKVGMAS